MEQKHAELVKKKERLKHNGVSSKSKTKVKYDMCKL